MNRVVRIYFISANEDGDLKEGLINHLRRLTVSNLSDYKVGARIEWSIEIGEDLNGADILLVLVSASLLGRTRSYPAEIELAMLKHNQHEAVVIPIIIRPVNWENEPFHDLKVLPDEGKPVISWPDKDEAFVAVSSGIRKVFRELICKKYIVAIEKCMNADKYEEVYVLCEEAVSFFPQEASFHKTLGDTFFSRGLFTEALEKYEAAINLDSQNAKFYVCKAKVCVQLGQHNNVLIACVQAVAIAADVVSIYEDVGDILLSIEDFERSLKAYNKAIELDPDNPQLHLTRGKILSAYARMNQNNALASYEKAIYLQPDDPELYTYKGEAHFALMDFEEALKAYEEAISKAPEDAQLWRHKGNMLAELGRLEEALKAYQEASKYSLENSYIHKERGDLLVKLNKFSEAANAYTKAIELDPRFVHAYRDRARVYEKLAAQDIEKVKELEEEQGDM